MATGNLGSATFTITADSGPFQQGIQKAKQGAQELTQHIQSQTRGAAMSMMMLGQTVDDLQYGFRSIVNNIQPMGQAIASSLGASTIAAMAFGGAVSIIAVAINQLINHWDTLVSSFQARWSGSTVEQLEAIREKAEKAAEAWDKLNRAQSEFATKGIAGLQKAILESPGGAGGVAGRLAGALSTNPSFEAGMTQDEKNRIFIARGEIKAGREKGDPGLAQRATKRLNEVYGEMAKRMIGQALEPGAGGTNARLAVGRLLPELKPALEAADPEAQKRQKDFAKQADVRKEVEARIQRDIKAKNQKELDEANMRGQAEKRRQTEKDKTNREIEQLNRQGLANEEHGNREAERERKEDERKRNQARMGHERTMEHRDRAMERINKIMNEPFAETKSQFFGAAEFSKMIQSGTLNEASNQRKEMIERLKSIDEILKQQGMGRMTIKGQMVAGTPA